MEEFNKIRELCGNTIVLKKTKNGEPLSVLPFNETISKIEMIFQIIDFDYGKYPEWDLKDAVEMASDEDQVGAGVVFGERDLTLSEVAINTYCLYLDIPSPTFGHGLLINPLSTI